MILYSYYHESLKFATSAAGTAWIPGGRKKSRDLGWLIRDGKEGRTWARCCRALGGDKVSGWLKMLSMSTSIFKMNDLRRKIPVWKFTFCLSWLANSRYQVNIDLMNSNSPALTDFVQVPAQRLIQTGCPSFARTNLELDGVRFPGELPAHKVKAW